MKNGKKTFAITKDFKVVEILYTTEFKIEATQVAHSMLFEQTARKLLNLKKSEKMSEKQLQDIVTEFAYWIHHPSFLKLQEGR